MESKYDANRKIQRALAFHRTARGHASLDASMVRIPCASSSSGDRIPRASRAVQSPIQTSRLPPPAWSDSSRHCQSAPRRSSQSSIAVQFGRQIPPLREMQLNASGQSLLVSQAGVQTPSGKLPPVMHRAPPQSASVVHELPTASDSPQEASITHAIPTNSNLFIRLPPICPAPPIQHCTAFRRQPT